MRVRDLRTGKLIQDTARPRLAAPTARLLEDLAHELRVAGNLTHRSDWCIEIPKKTADALLRRINRALAREKGKP